MADRTYSHTSLALWRLCKRRWYRRYVRGLKEPPGPEAAFSVHLVHKALEMWLEPVGATRRRLAGVAGLEEAEWQELWTQFFTQVPDDFTSYILSLATAKKVLAQFLETPIAHSANMRSEQTFQVQSPSGLIYTSRPDLLYDDYAGRRTTADLKFTTSTWYGGRPWPVKPLARFNDQLLGQAICAGADRFCRLTWRGDRKTGKLASPILEEQPMDAKLRDEWLSETFATMDEIENWCGEAKRNATFPKDDSACHAFGRPCPGLTECNLGC